jgi:hypothetical protein
VDSASRAVYGSLLFGVTPLDAVSYAATAAVMLGVSAPAC